MFKSSILARARDHLRDALGRKVGLDRQIRAAGLENREHRGQPVEVPLGHHADDRFVRDAARHQGSGKLIGAGIELPVRELPVAVHGGDGVRTVPGLDLEQFVGPAVGQRSTRSGAHVTAPAVGAQHAAPVPAPHLRLLALVDVANTSAISTAILSGQTGIAAATTHSRGSG